MNRPTCVCGFECRQGKIGIFHAHKRCCKQLEKTLDLINPFQGKNHKIGNVQEFVIRKQQLITTMDNNRCIICGVDNPFHGNKGWLLEHFSTHYQQ